MKATFFWRVAVLLGLFLATSVSAQDMRQVQVQAYKAKEALIRQAEAEKATAEKEAAQSRVQITQDRKSLEAAIAELEAANRKLSSGIKRLEAENTRLNAAEAELGRKLAQTDKMVQELVGVIRVNAKDIRSLNAQNLQAALNPVPAFLGDVAVEARFPGMTDVRRMVGFLKDQIDLSGQVFTRKETIIGREGQAVAAELLFLGPFSAAYCIGEEKGFLNYTTADGKLFALSRLPSRRMQATIGRYMDGLSETVPMDISRGGALRQLTHELQLWEQIPKGGPIVWPILAILAIGILIILERVFFLIRKRFDANKLIQRIEALSAENKWDACLEVCACKAKKPVVRVVQAGLSCRQMQREEMENALQEAILREVPAMERFLATLGMLATIAPLLGLLGTVTGMIDTFHVITLHGTGDPRLMSGGISEALVTTMLGLSVAIPLMLAQTLLNRAVDKKIGQMEEKGVALVNIIQKNRGPA